LSTKLFWSRERQTKNRHRAVWSGNNQAAGSRTAETTADESNKRIAWRALPGGDVEYCGSITFIPTAVIENRWQRTPRKRHAHIGTQDHFSRRKIRGAVASAGSHEFYFALRIRRFEPGLLPADT
jgi:hypothetical protein